MHFPDYSLIFRVNAVLRAPSSSTGLFLRISVGWTSYKKKPARKILFRNSFQTIQKLVLYHSWKVSPCKKHKHHRVSKSILKSKSINVFEFKQAVMCYIFFRWIHFSDFNNWNKKQFISPITMFVPITDYKWKKTMKKTTQISIPELGIYPIRNQINMNYNKYKKKV